MKQRLRISSQQKTLLTVIAGNPWGACKDEIYLRAYGIDARWNVRNRVLPLTLKNSVHRSLVKLADAGFLQRIHDDSHEGRVWKLTIAGKALADKFEIPIKLPLPPSAAVLARLAELEGRIASAV